MFSQIDLSGLPAPDIIEALSFETILADMKAAVIAQVPEIETLLSIESEPVTKLLEVFAYREILLRARINDAARAVLLAYATGGDLDNLAALYGVARLITAPADPLADPPTDDVLETDASLRARTQLALEGFSTAGPRGAYLFHALSADGRVKDAGVSSPAPGEVRVIVLSTEDQGIPSAPVITAVNDALNAEDIRPLCDTVNVLPAAIITYTVEASLHLFEGPDAELIRAQAEAAVLAYADASHRVGRAVRLSALAAALHQPNVESITVTSPLADILPTSAQAAFCTGVTITIAP